MAKVKNFTEEPINLKSNRNLVSFTEKETIKKIEIHDVLMAFGFEDQKLQYDDYSLCFNQPDFDSKSEISEIEPEEEI